MVAFQKVLDRRTWYYRSPTDLPSHQPAKAQHIADRPGRNVKQLGQLIDFVHEDFTAGRLV